MKGFKFIRVFIYICILILILFFIRNTIQTSKTITGLEKQLSRVENTANLHKQFDHYVVRKYSIAGEESFIFVVSLDYKFLDEESVDQFLYAIGVE